MIAGLPEEALLARPMGQAEIWTRTHELLATVAEVVSVQAAEKALKKPIQIPRPQRQGITAEERREIRNADATPISEAVDGLAATGRVRKAPPRQIAAPAAVPAGAP